MAIRKRNDSYSTMTRLRGSETLTDQNSGVDAQRPADENKYYDCADAEAPGPHSEATSILDIFALPKILPAHTFLLAGR